MKTILRATLICGMFSSALAQTTPAPANNPPKHHHKKTANPDGSGTNAAPDTSSADQAKQVAEYQKTFVPADPWRVMDDKTNYAKGADWVQFEGTVLQTSAEGIVLQGTFGEPLFYLLPNNGGATTGKFVLSGYPRAVAVGQALSRNDRLVALKAGTTNDMPLLNYGSVYVPELTAEQKAQLAQSKSKTDAKVLAWQQDLADKGDAYGQYKMGLRYLNGDGVDKDLAKAKDLLGKSAAQGNQDATDALAKLPSN